MIILKDAQGRSILLLEGLWDQLEYAIDSLNRVSEQPREAFLASSRLTSCKLRLGQLLGDSELRSSTHALSISTKSALTEVAALLDSLSAVPEKKWIEVLYEAQDVVLDSLHGARNVYPRSTSAEGLAP